MRQYARYFWLSGILNSNAHAPISTMGTTAPSAISLIRSSLISSQYTASVCYNSHEMSDSDRTYTSNATLNKLRAAVLGANDGIVSTASVVMGVAGATTNTKTIFTAGLAALVAGA